MFNLRQFNYWEDTFIISFENLKKIGTLAQPNMGYRMLK